MYDTPNGDKLFLKKYPIVTLTSLKYRTGLVSVPTYVEFNADDYLLYSEEGYIKFFANFASLNGFEQGIRVVYDAGYLIDFTAITNPALHTLPLDLTQLANELVGFEFNRRTSQGISSETTEGQSITYNTRLSENDLSAAQKMIISNYTTFTLTI